MINYLSSLREFFVHFNKGLGILWFSLARFNFFLIIIFIYSLGEFVLSCFIRLKRQRLRRESLRYQGRGDGRPLPQPGQPRPGGGHGPPDGPSGTAGRDVTEGPRGL